MSKRSTSLYIQPDAYEYLWAYIDAVNTEIGGFGYIFREDDGSFTWTDTFIVKQEVSTGAVDYTDEGLSQVVEKAAKDGVLGEERFSWMMWHSHGDMMVGWSGTDEKDQVEKMRDFSGVSHLFSFVGNRSHEYKLRLDIFDNPLVEHITLHEVNLLRLRDSRILDGVDRDIKANVTKKTYPKITTVAASKKGGKELVPIGTGGPVEWSSDGGYDRQAWAELWEDDDVEWDTNLCMFVPKEADYNDLGITIIDAEATEETEDK